MSAVVDALAGYPGLTIQGAAATAITCLVEQTPLGEEAFSWVAFVVDRHNPGTANLHVRPGQFTLSWTPDTHPS